MKKLATLILACLPMLAMAYGNREHQYRITFSDGKECSPIYTCSLSTNYFFEDGIGIFYYNDNIYSRNNMRAIELCGVKEHLDFNEPCRYWFKNGRTQFNHVKSVEDITP